MRSSKSTIPVSFIPPESLNLGESSKRFDLYSFAVLTYAMCGGELYRDEFTTQNCEEAHKFITEQLKKLNGIPDEIKDVLGGCLRGEYQNTSKLKSALELPAPDNLEQLLKDIVNQNTQHDKVPTKKRSWVISVKSQEMGAK